MIVNKLSEISYIFTRVKQVYDSTYELNIVHLSYIGITTVKTTLEVKKHSIVETSIHE